MSRRRIGGLCGCGCGRQCAARRNKWATPNCVPRTVRQANGRSARKTYAFIARSQKFKDILDRLTSRRVNREELLAVFMDIYERGYNSGLMTAHRRLASQQKGAAA